MGAAVRPWDARACASAPARPLLPPLGRCHRQAEGCIAAAASGCQRPCSRRRPRARWTARVPAARRTPAAIANAAWVPQGRDGGSGDPRWGLCKPAPRAELGARRPPGSPAGALPVTARPCPKKAHTIPIATLPTPTMNALCRQLLAGCAPSQPAARATVASGGAALVVPWSRRTQARTMGFGSHTSGNECAGGRGRGKGGERGGGAARGAQRRRGYSRAASINDARAPPGAPPLHRSPDVLEKEKQRNLQGAAPPRAHVCTRSRARHALPASGPARCPRSHAPSAAPPPHPAPRAQAARPRWCRGSRGGTPTSRARARPPSRRTSAPRARARARARGGARGREHDVPLGLLLVSRFPTRPQAEPAAAVPLTPPQGALHGHGRAPGEDGAGAQRPRGDAPRQRRRRAGARARAPGLRARPAGRRARARGRRLRAPRLAACNPQTQRQGRRCAAHGTLVTTPPPHAPGRRARAAASRAHTTPAAPRRSAATCEIEGRRAPLSRPQLCLWASK